MTLKNSETLFTIASGNESLFGVSEDGRLFTKKPLLLDRNSQPGYNITVEVSNVRPYSNGSLRNDNLHVFLRLMVSHADISPFVTIAGLWTPNNMVYVIIQGAGGG